MYFKMKINNIYLTSILQPYFRIMKCTILKLFVSTLGSTVCGGQLSTLGALPSAADYLGSHNCLIKGTNHSLAELVMNRIVPDRIDLEKIKDLDICDDHKRALTNRHKSTRQVKCSYPGCIKSGRKNKARISFEVSALLFDKCGVHIPVGYTLCHDHHNLVTQQSDGLVEMASKNPLDGPAQPPESVDNSDEGLGFADKGTLCEILTEKDMMNWNVLGHDQENKKRKQYPETYDQPSKLKRESSLAESESSCYSNSQSLVASQGSTFSSTSDVLNFKNMDKFNCVLEYLKCTDLDLNDQLVKPLDLSVQYRTLNKYVILVGSVLRNVFESLVIKSDDATESCFLKMIFNYMNVWNESDRKTVDLALNVMDSIATFYSIAAQDESRNGVTSRKVLLQAITGEKVKSANQVELLSEFIGARRQTVSEEGENRKVLEEKQTLMPFLKMQGRKAPHGVRYISEQIRLEVIEFYEKSDISDVMKENISKILSCFFICKC